MNARKELELMIKLLNEKVFEYPQKLELIIKRREDLGGVLAFLNLTTETLQIPVPPATICWAGAGDAASACGVIIKKFAEGSGLIKRYIPFTAGSFEELRIKASAFYG